MISLISLINKFPLGNPAEKGYFLYKGAPQGFLRNLSLSNFKKTVLFAAEHSKFYQKKFKERNINPSKIKAPGDLGDFFTTAEDIRENPEGFICLKPDTAFETTGTTSKKPKRVYFSRHEIKEAGWAGAVGLWGLGVRPEDRVASAFDNLFWVSGPVLQSSCEALGCFHVESGRMKPEEFYERLSDYRITVIVGDPSWIVGLTEVAEKKGAWPVKLLIGGGENMSEATRIYIEKVWKAALVLSYGQTEAFGAIGMETRDKDGYHLNSFHNLFEIIHPDTEGYGELVYTTMNRRVMPLVRYRSGDITRFLEGPSRSGLPGQRIEKLKGRVDEWMATAMGNIAPWMFETIFNGIAGISEDWQVVVNKENNKDLIEFHVEVSNGAAIPATIMNGILLRIRDQLPDAWKWHERGSFRLDLKIHPKGTLRAGRKLKRILDRRLF